MSVSLSKKLVFINSMSSLMRRGIQITVLVWVHQHLLRRITPEEYSLLPVVIAIMAFFPIISTVLSSGISRAVITAVAQGDDEQVIRITSSVLPLLVAGAFFVIGVGFILGLNLERIILVPAERLAEGRIMLALMVLSFAYSLVVSVYQTGIHVRQKYVLANAIGLAAQLLKFFLLFGLLTFVEARVAFVVLATTVATLAEQTALTFASRRLLKILQFKPRFFDWITAREIMSFGGWISFAQVGGMIYRSADPILLNRFATPVDVACFSVGGLIQRHLQPLMAAATLPITPVLVAMHTRGDHPGLVKSFCHLSRCSMWFIGFAIIPFLMVRDEFFRLYLAESYSLYSNVGTVALLTLAPMILLYAVNNGLDKIAIATGKVEVYVILIVSTQLFNLFLTLVFVGWLKFGATGSAMATCGSWLLFIPLGYLPLALRLTNMKLVSYISQILFPGLKPIVAAIVFGLVWRYFCVPSGWISLFLFFSSTGIFYVLILILFSLHPSERQALNNFLLAKIKELSITKIFRYQANL